MRMRKKKNLEERLEKCSEYIIRPRAGELNFNAEFDDSAYLNYQSLFENNNCVEMEIGCGKGQFILLLAKQNPNINYIAVEKSSNVVVEACEKAMSENVKNVKFMICSAEYLPRYIPEKSVKRIYLNFSCPFPKNTYASHRLTNEKFLKIYSRILDEGAEIHQKTDNMHFFEYSLEEYSRSGFKIKNISLDLHNSGFEGNIETEYEKKFSSQGYPIYRVEAYIG